MRGNCGSEFACWTGMRPFTEDDVQKDYAYFFVLRLLFHAAKPQIVVYHRMQATNGEFIPPKI